MGTKFDTPVIFMFSVIYTFQKRTKLDLNLQKDVSNKDEMLVVVEQPSQYTEISTFSHNSYLILRFGKRLLWSFIINIYKK